MVLRRATELQLTTSIVGMVLSSFGLLSAVSLSAFIILGRYHRADKAMILRQAEEGGANVGPGLVFSNLHGQHPERAHAWAGGRGGPTEGRLLAATVVSWQRLCDLPSFSAASLPTRPAWPTWQRTIRYCCARSCFRVYLGGIQGHRVISVAGEYRGTDMYQGHRDIGGRATRGAHAQRGWHGQGHAPAAAQVHGTREGHHSVGKASHRRSPLVSAVAVIK